MSAAAIRALAGQLAIIDCIWLSLNRCIGICADTGVADIVASAKVTVAILLARDDKVMSFFSDFGNAKLLVQRTKLHVGN